MIPLTPVDGELAQVKQQLVDTQAAFDALASGQVDSIAWPTGPMLVRQAQEALLRSEQKFRSLIEHLPNLVWVHRHGRLVYANPNTLRSVGCEDAAELVGRELTDWLASVSARDARLNPYEVQLRQRSGSVLAIEATDQAIVYDGDLATLTVGQDITERKRLEAHVLIADRMASIGMLAAGVAHEINNPLAFVIANLEFVSSRVGRWAKEHPEQTDPLTDTSSALSDALQGAERVRLIVRDLKEFSSPNDSQRGPVNVIHMLDAAANMAAHEIRYRARLVKDYGTEPLTVDGNEARLFQVILNLLVNAAHAIPEGDTEANVIRLSACQDPDGRVRIEVTDSGKGMTREVQARLFTPFFTTKPKGFGTGLGLSISQKIVASHGGDIEAESAPGKGSTFRVLLPSLAPSRRVAGTSRQVGSGRRGRVLIIDDEKMLGTSLKRLLSSEHDIELDTSAKAALSRLATDDAFDVVLCDMMMPDMTGAQLFEAISVSNPALARRFVFLTGGAFTPETQAFLESITNPVVGKPIEVEQLLTIIAGVIARSPSPAASH